jgi:hypothetical protein
MSPFPKYGMLSYTDQMSDHEMVEVMFILTKFWFSSRPQHPPPALPPRRSTVRLPNRPFYDKRT